MNFLVRIVIVLVALVLMQAADAQTRSKLLDATDPARIATVIQEMGYRAKLEAEEGSTPTIISSVGGTEFFLQFLACEGENTDCRVLLFKVGYDKENGSPQEVVEDWNETTLIGRAYLDDENDPWLEYAVNLYGGVTRTNFEDSFDWWEVIVEQFEDHIDF